MALDAGAAFIDVQGKLDGLESTLSGQGVGLFTKFAEHAKGILSAAVPLAIVGGLFKIGETFDEQFDKIRTDTGKTGKALTGLEDSFKNVARGVPNSFADIGQAIDGITVKLGLTGKPLEGLATQVLNLSRVTKTDLAGNVELVTGLFNNWNVAAKDQQLRLDELFRAHQQTGVAVADLAGQMSKGGAVLRTLGFSYEQGAALVGVLSKNGLDATPILAGFSKSIATMAKAGETFPDTFRRIIGEIQNAKDPVAATAEAVHLFGARSGPKLAELIREGKLGVDQLAASILGGKDTINSAASDTLHFSEQWKIFSHRLLVDVEPVAVAVFRGIGDAMTELGPLLDDVTHAVTPVGKAFSTLFDAWKGGGLSGLGDAFAHLSTPMKIATVAVVALGLALWAAFSPVTLIIAVLVAVGFAVYTAWQRFSVFRDVVRTVVAFITGTIWPALKAFATGVADQFGHLVAWVQKHWAAIREAIGHVVNVIVDIVNVGLAVILELWNTFGGSIISVIQAAWAGIGEVISAAVEIVSNLFSFFIDIINGDWGKAWNDLVGVLQGVWDLIFGVIRYALAIVSAVLGAGLNAIGVVWDALWHGFTSIVSGVWGTVTGLVSSGIGAVWGVVKLIGSAISGAWSSIWGGFKKVVSDVWGDIEGAVVHGVNAVIHVINGFIRVYDAVASAVSDIPGVPNLPHIDTLDTIKLHSGGIYRAPNGVEGLALLRDRERVVTPEQDAADARRGSSGGQTSGLYVENLYAWNAREAAAELERERVWAALVA